MLMDNPDNGLAEAFGIKRNEEVELEKPTTEQDADDAVGGEANATEADAEAVDDDVDGEAEEAEEADDVEEDSDDKPEEYRTVKIDGEEVKVPISELEAGYMRDADYRRKTTEVSALKKEVAADGERLEKGLDALVKQLTIAEQLVRESTFNLTDEQLDKLAVENPAELVRLQRIEEKNRQKLMLLHDQLEQAKSLRQRETEALVEKHRKQERKKLEEKVPFYRKPDSWDKLVTYLKSETYGLDDEVINSVTDHRFAMLADKAMRYDALMAKGKDRKERVAAKVLKPSGARPSTGDSKGEVFQRGVSQVKKGNKDALTDLIGNFL
jgi:hypothetical protein